VKSAFSMAIILEEKILSLYQRLKIKVKLPKTFFLIRSLIHTKEHHIKILENCITSGDIDKICANKSKTSVGLVLSPFPRASV
jgi:hypothetical protein